jgi:hypothetical protein
MTTPKISKELRAVFPIAIKSGTPTEYRIKRSNGDIKYWHGIPFLGIFDAGSSFTGGQLSSDGDLCLHMTDRAQYLSKLVRLHEFCELNPTVQCPVILVSKKFKPHDLIKTYCEKHDIRFESTD